jgi:hypothetical protein
MRYSAGMANVPRIDEVERLGAAVEARRLGRADAIAQLLQIFDGGLTLTGAASYIDNWSTVRADCIRATTPEPKVTHHQGRWTPLLTAGDHDVSSV